MFNPMQTQQLNLLLGTVNEITADSISQWHQALVEEVRAAMSQIERLTVAANQAALVQQMAQVFERQEHDIVKPLELPLKALRNLVENGVLTESQKMRLLIELGKTHNLLTQWDTALNQFYQALDYCQDSPPEKAEILKFIGHIKSKQHNYHEAKSHYRASMAIYSELKNLHQVAYVFISLGWNDFQLENYSDAEANYQKALEIIQGLSDAERLIGDVHMNMAILATVRGDFQTAIAYYEKGVQCYESIGDARGLAQVYYNMAMLSVDMKAWTRAGAYYQQSLEYTRRHSDLYLIGHIHLGRTELALQLMDLALAQASCIQAIRVFGRLRSQSHLAEAYKYAGRIRSYKKAWDKAEHFFQKSIQLAAACRSCLNQAEAHYEYGLMLMDKPDREKAKLQLHEALKLFTQLGAEVDIQKTQAILARLAVLNAETTSRPRFKRIGQA
jgi:tetratricopeptide (TPR) repeat protein